MLNKQIFLILLLISCAFSTRLFSLDDQKTNDSCIEVAKEPEKIINSSSTTRFELKVILKNTCKISVDLSNDFKVLIKTLKVNGEVFSGPVYSSVEPGMFNLSRNDNGLLSVSMKTRDIKPESIIVVTIRFSIMESNGTFSIGKAYTSATKPTFSLIVSNIPTDADVSCALRKDNGIEEKGTYDPKTKILTFPTKVYADGYRFQCKGYIDNLNKTIVDPKDKIISIDSTEIGLSEIKEDYMENKIKGKSIKYTYTLKNDPYTRNFYQEKVYDDMEKYSHNKPKYEFTTRYMTADQITPKGDRLRYRCVDPTYCPKSTTEVVKSDGTVEVTFDFKN